MRKVPLALAALLGCMIASPCVVRADFADYEALDKYCLMLKQKHLNPFPMCNEKTGKGSIGLNDGKVYWNEATKVYVPGGKYVLTTETSQGKVISVSEVQGGWKPGYALRPREGDVFVNVGPSSIEFEGERLRKGEYVLFDGTTLVRGSLRPPDRVRVEPRDTNRENAAQLLSVAFFAKSVGDYSTARVKFREVALTYSDTTSGERALAALNEIGEKGPPNAPAKAKLAPIDTPAVPDSVFVKEDGQSDEAAADHLLSLGITWKALKQYEKVKIVLLGLHVRYPGSKAADKARGVLDSLPGSVNLAAK